MDYVLQQQVECMVTSVVVSASIETPLQAAVPRQQSAQLRESRLNCREHAEKLHQQQVFRDNRQQGHADEASFLQFADAAAGEAKGQ